MEALPIHLLLACFRSSPSIGLCEVTEESHAKNDRPFPFRNEMVYFVHKYKEGVFRAGLK